MALNSYKDLVKEQLQDLYDAESQFAANQPAIAEAAADPALRDALEQHVEVTKKQIQRLEEVARELGISTNGKTCLAATGLIQEAMELIEGGGDPMVLDAAIIAAAQRIEHYEIAAYGTLKSHVGRLGHTKAAKQLEDTLAEERGADVLLTELAEKSINALAAT